MTAQGGRLGQYNVVKTLGEGSFGKVKLAVHSATGQKVALKIINRETLSNLDTSARVEREIQYLKLLRHPHIIKLYEVITTATDIIMVIEYAGGELFDYIVRRGKMTEEEARRFFQQIISAVEYCHRHKIVHRDLKPENLLLDEFLNVKIADFGLSNIMTDGNFLKTSCGSPNYAAPEVISGKLYAGPEVDVWSCGVILYVMICGRLPFDDEYIPTLFKKINGGMFSIPSYLSPGAKALLARMLVVNPIQRITIQEIRESKWFMKDLPSYLSPVSGVTGPADDGIVNKVGIAMGYEKDDVYAALKKPEGNEIKDVYNLVAENQMMLKENKLASKEMQSFLAQSPPAYNSMERSASDRMNAIKSDPSQNAPHAASPLSRDLAHPGIIRKATLDVESSSSIAILPSSLPAYHEAVIGHARPPADLKKAKPTRWHFGIRSRSPPLEVMLEIYRALESLQAEWIAAEPTFTPPQHRSPSNTSTPSASSPIPEDPFYIKCRRRIDGNVCNIEIQLYALEGNNYLVDFKFSGYSDSDDHAATEKEVNSPFPFLDIATRLITELAVAG